MNARFFSLFPLWPKMGVYVHFTSVEWALDLRKCTSSSVHFPSLIGAFDSLEVIEVFPDGAAGYELSSSSTTVLTNPRDSSLTKTPWLEPQYKWIRSPGGIYTNHVW